MPYNDQGKHLHCDIRLTTSQDIAKNMHLSTKPSVANQDHSAVDQAAIKQVQSAAKQSGSEQSMEVESMAIPTKKRSGPAKKRSK